MMLIWIPSKNERQFDFARLLDQKEGTYSKTFANCWKWIPKYQITNILPISDDKDTKIQSNSNQAFERNISLFSPIASEKKNSETVQKNTLENLEQVIASSSSNLSLEQETFERYWKNLIIAIVNKTTIIKKIDNLGHFFQIVNLIFKT